MTIHRIGDDRWTFDCSDEEAEMIIMSLKKNHDVYTESATVQVDGVTRYQLVMHHSGSRQAREAKR
jgi:hypothetical protein